MTARLISYAPLVGTLIFSLLCGKMANAAEVSDREIQEGVEHALRQDADLGASSIQVTVDRRVVHLKGSAASLAVKNIAVQEAEKIRGATAVVDEMVIRWVKRQDVDVAKSVRRHLLGGGVQSENLKVECKEGAVTLTGDVAGFAQIQLAKTLAGDIAGVKSIKEKLYVETIKHRSDTDIKRDIETSFKRNVFLHHLPLQVTVHEGHVTLAGVVSNPYERRLAEREVAYVSHVNGIDNEIEVDQSLDVGEATHRPKFTDEEIAGHVKSALSQDEQVARMPIKVRVVNAEVFLTGTANVSWQKDAAERVASNTLGVVLVSNKIKVDPTYRTDDSLEQELTVDLGADALLHHQQLRVNVVNGAATLSGIVNNLRQYRQAETVAKRIHGVREVINLLDIEPRDVVGDADAAKALRSSLKWNITTPQVAPLVEVAMDNGVATLKGKVAYQWQKNAVERVAFHTAGVRKVENRLTIAPVE